MRRPAALGRLIPQATPPPYSPWSAIPGAEQLREKASAGGAKVLVATSLGGYEQGVILESVLVAALALRGADVDVLLCDEFLPACQLTKFDKVGPLELVLRGPRRLCGPCFDKGTHLFDPVAGRVLRYSDNVGPAEHELAERLSREVPADEIGSWRYGGLAVGEHALAGALRYYGRGDLTGQRLADKVVRRYLRAALLTVFALRRLLRDGGYDIAVFHHGIYVPQGLIGEVCREQGVRVVNSNPAYRDKTFIFSHGDTYHHTMISEPTSVWTDMPWNAELESRTMTYLHSRRRGSDDWIHFNDTPDERVDALQREVGIDLSRPTVGLLTNVLWDAQLHYSSNAFPDMLSWVEHTVRWFGAHPELNLVIRIHPAEVTGAVPSRQPLEEELSKRFPTMPANVFVVPPGSKISTYTLLENCDSALIYNTKTGIELASLGIPVVVAGEAWIRGKGFSFDATSAESYDGLLEQLPFGRRLDVDQLKLARRYAFHFFFRRMIPLPVVSSPTRFALRLDLTDLEPLRPGATPGLDVICQGILQGSPFIYPAEQQEAAT